MLSVKRLMGTGTRVQMGGDAYSPQEISAFILKELKARAARALGRDVQKAVITVPAYFTDAQRQATREAGEIAGLTVVRILNEPTAAALSYESGTAGRRTLLVYDLGGGTFDVSVVRVEAGVVEVLATAGDNQLGGDDFDALLLERFNARLETELGLEHAREDRVLQARLRRAAERAKIELSDRPWVQVEEDHVGTVGGEARHLACELSRADFERDLEPFVGRSLQAVTTALQGRRGAPEPARPCAAGRRLHPHPADRGRSRGTAGAGTARRGGSRAVRGARGERAGGDRDGARHAGGAGRHHALHVRDPRGGRALRHAVCAPCTCRSSGATASCPATRTEVFFTMFEDQEEVDVKVYQGEDPDALKNVEIGNFRFSGLNRRRDAHAQGLLFTYTLDLDGLLHVHARERATGREVRGVVENALGRSSEEALGASRERVSALWGEAGGEGVRSVADGAAENGGGKPAPAVPADVARAVEETLARAGRALAAAPAEDREEMIDLMEDLRDAVREGRAGPASELRRRLDEILFYLE